MVEQVWSLLVPPLEPVPLFLGTAPNLEILVACPQQQSFVDKLGQMTNCTGIEFTIIGHPTPKLRIHLFTYLFR